MGTNFYTVKDKKHIGKRSAAGWYCWDCKITLCESEEMVHTGKGKWYDACPVCDEKLLIEDLSKSSAGRELGFNKSKPKKKIGVASVSSFSWAMKPNIFFMEKPEIIDEYDEIMTFKTFMKFLDECPIQYYDSIGETFS